jgi:hypothetical protein
VRLFCFEGTAGYNNKAGPHYVLTLNLAGIAPNMAQAFIQTVAIA